MDIKVQSFSLSTKWLKFVLKLGFGNMSKVSNNSISTNCASVRSKIDLFQVYEQIYELLTNRHLRSRFALCSLWSVIFLFLLCVYCTLLFFGRAQTRALESKITPTYMHQKDRTLIKRVHLLRFLYPSLLQNLLSLFDRQSHQALVEAFQNVDYMVLKWKHWIVFIT